MKTIAEIFKVVKDEYFNLLKKKDFNHPLVKYINKDLKFQLNNVLLNSGIDYKNYQVKCEITEKGHFNNAIYIWINKKKGFYPRFSIRIEFEERKNEIEELSLTLRFPSSPDVTRKIKDEKKVRIENSVNNLGLKLLKIKLKSIEEEKIIPLNYSEIKKPNWHEYKYLWAYLFNIYQIKYSLNNFDEISENKFRNDLTEMIRIMDYFNKLDFTKERNEMNAILGNEITSQKTEQKDSNMSLNTILYGPPGTGKTYHSISYAISILENKSLPFIIEEERKEVISRFKKYKEDGRIEFITFHQSYSYEDFIQGIKPNLKNNSDQISFSLEKGIFYKINERALKSSEPYVLIIDEINRGNISRIFGELITLIEEDKRKGNENELSVKLPNSEEPFVVAPNLYIIGTMNTADKSIALVDIALRRRFEFVKMYPDLDKVHKSLKNTFGLLNKAITEKKKSPDFQIGHSFFIGKTKDDLQNIFDKKILPLLNEYFQGKNDEIIRICKFAKLSLKECDGILQYAGIIDNTESPDDDESN